MSRETVFPSPSMLAINGCDKVSIAFAAGAVMALRECQKLAPIRCLGSVGTGNVVLYFLIHCLRQCSEGLMLKVDANASGVDLDVMDVTHSEEEKARGVDLDVMDVTRCIQPAEEEGWIQLTQHGPLRDHFLSPLLEFLESPTEWNVWFQWPWKSYVSLYAEEIRTYARQHAGRTDSLQEHGVYSNTMDTNALTLPRLFLFHATEITGDKSPLVCITNDAGCDKILSPQQILRPPSRSSTSSFSRMVAESSFPFLEQVDPHDTTRSYVHALREDPLGTAGLKEYYRHFWQGKPKHHSADLCIVIDSVSGTKWATDHHLDPLLEECGETLVQPEDFQLSNLKAHRSQLVCMLDSRIRAFHDPHDNDNDASHFLGTLAANPCRFEGLDRLLAMDIMNWGYALTLHLMNAEQKKTEEPEHVLFELPPPPPLLFPERGDVHHFYDTLNVVYPLA